MDAFGQKRRAERKRGRENCLGDHWSVEGKVEAVVVGVVAVAVVFAIVAAFAMKMWKKVVKLLPSY